MIFCGPAKKVTMRIDANDVAWAPVCEALIAFLCPKDVSCLQVSFCEDAVEIQFLARKGKLQALMEVTSLIAPSAAIYVERTTVVHAKAEAHLDLMHERAEWESSLRFRSAFAVEKECSPALGEVLAPVNGAAVRQDFRRSGRR